MVWFLSMVYLYLPFLCQESDYLICSAFSSLITLADARWIFEQSFPGHPVTGSGSSQLLSSSNTHSIVVTQSGQVYSTFTGICILLAVVATQGQAGDRTRDSSKSRCEFLAGHPPRCRGDYGEQDTLHDRVNRLPGCFETNPSCACLPSRTAIDCLGSHHL